MVCQLCGYIPSVHIHNNQSAQGLALQLAQLASDFVDDLRTSIDTSSGHMLIHLVADGTIEGVFRTCAVKTGKSLRKVLRRKPCGSRLDPWQWDVKGQSIKQKGSISKFALW